MAWLPEPPVRLTPTTIIGNGQTVTERILEQIKAGTHPETAAASVGLPITEYRRIIRDGVHVTARYQAGADWLTDFTPEERAAAAFYTEVDKAARLGESIRRTILERLARGDYQITKTRTRRDATNQIIETVETVESYLPDAQTIRWLLERESPAIYGQRSTVELSVTDTTDTDLVGEIITQRLIEMANRLGGAIDTTATDGP